jgi:hypothetical protein
MRKRTWAVVGAPLMMWLACAAGVVTAQVVTNSTEGINATGTATVQRRATMMRVQVQLVAQGPDAPAAMARLKETQAAARKKLAELGASGEGAIRFAPVQIELAPAAPTDPRAAMMAQVMAQRAGARAKKPATGPTDKPTKLTVGLQADLPLSGNSDEEVLANAAALAKKVREADIANKRGAASNLTPQEQEEQEEAQAQVQQQFGGMPAPPDPLEPTISFVAKLSDDDRAAAATEAFKHARDDAARTAGAAGAGLGAIRTLTSQVASADALQNTNPYANVYQMYGMNAGANPLAAAFTPSPDEAVGQQPLGVTYRVTVTTSFHIK